MVTVPQFIMFYAIIALIAVLITVYDKVASVKSYWRIRESTLLFVGLIGGALPMFITMKLIRHKTKHKKFMIGLPVEMAVHIIAVAIIFYLLPLTYTA